MLIRTSRFELEAHCASRLRAGCVFLRLGRREYWYEWGAASAA